MNQKEARFLPFHAINQFMLDDFRDSVIHATLKNLADLPDQTAAEIDRWTRKFVTVPGFRNSAKSPWQLRAKSTTTAFGKNTRLAAAILAGWAEINKPLAQQVLDFLKERGWEVLPLDADRTLLPGFLTRWPAAEDFDTLTTGFREKYPGTEHSNDEINLMAVWISTRLPYEKVTEDEISITDSD